MAHPAPRCPEGYDQECVFAYLCDGGESEEQRRFAEHLESTGCEACTQELRSLRFLQEELTGWKPGTNRVDHPLWALAADEAAHPPRQCSEGYDQECVFAYLCDGGESEEQRRFAEHLESTGCEACTRELRSLRFLQESLSSWNPSTDPVDHPLWAMADADLPAGSTSESVPGEHAHAYAPAAAGPQPSFVLRYAWGLGLAATLVVVVAGPVWQQYLSNGARPGGGREFLIEELASQAAPLDSEREALAPLLPEREPEPGSTLSVPSSPMGVEDAVPPSSEDRRTALQSRCSQDMGRLEPGTYIHQGEWDGSCNSVHYAAGEYARYFGVELTRPTLVAIELTSPTVNTWLALRNGTGTGTGLLEEDDDGGDGSNARIVRTLDAGLYTIEATTLDGYVTGLFTLTVTVE